MIQSVSRAARILRVVVASDIGLTNSEISDQVRLNVSTTHHLVRTLVDAGLLVRLPSGRYGIGHLAIDLHRGFVQHVRADPAITQLLNELAAESSETAYVCRWVDNCAVIDAIVEGSQAVRVGGLEVGFSQHSHLRASGKALLAALEESALRTYLLGAEFTKLTPNSVESEDELIEQLARARMVGYAEDLEEFDEGVCCISAPIRATAEVLLGAFTISVPRDRFMSRREELVAIVVDKATRATELVSGIGSGKAEKLVGSTVV